jgi:hypothetical protein
VHQGVNAGRGNVYLSFIRMGYVLRLAWKRHRSHPGINVGRGSV